MKLKLAMLFVGFLLSVEASAIEAKGGQADYLYTVKAGDNLSTFSATILDTTKRWPEVAQYNHVKNAQVITPGQVLRIQLAWLKNYPAQAKIESLTGAVLLNGKPAKVGDIVDAGAKLETPAGGSVRMSLPDGSTLNMLEKTQLEAKTLTKKEQGVPFESVFRLVTGRIDAIKKKYPDGQSPLRIQSMHATIGVRGTHFRMGQENGNTLAEIENGLVSFGDEAKAAPIPLAAAQGSVGDGAHNPVMIPLLPAPKFVLMPEFNPRALIYFALPDLAGAKGYRGELASDAEFMNLLAPIASDTALIKLPALALGRYWLRLRAVDEHGLQGLEGFTPIVVQEMNVPLPIELKPTSLQVEGDHLQVVWSGEAGLSYECHIASNPVFKFPLVNVVLSSAKLSIPSPDAGQYWMRVRAINADGKRSDWSEAMSFKVK
ncbi:MAG: FecR domain-containing protein [Sideroxydans sp.]|nr:FecR domain-containing protein [Sideroxydans sp.]